MPLIMTRVRVSDLPSYMAAMRAWLDARKCEPARFTHHRYGDAVAICVDFIKDSDAEAFKHRFHDDLPLDETQSEISILNEGQLPFRYSGNGSAEIDVRETMAHACWYRLMAEEVRTEADDFASEAARETMTIAARTWERLAEDLERRLAARGP